MPQREWTETVDLAQIDVAATMPRIKQLGEDLSLGTGNSSLDHPLVADHYLK
jgi:hypothetical protein